MSIIDALADAITRLFTMLGINVDGGTVDEILKPLADDIQLAYAHWTAFP